MMQRRKTENIRNLCNGPAKLVLALGIRKDQTGEDLRSGKLRLLAPRSYPGWNARKPPAIKVGPRIGISVGVNLPLRFYLADNAFVSKPFT
jgi:DNA-3-methyladenine glycosylase